MFFDYKKTFIFGSHFLFLIQNNTRKMERKVSIGIDIGGTNTEIGMVDADGEIIGKTSFKTRKYSTELSYINKLKTEISKLLEEFLIDSEVKGIGIGAPNGNYFTGRIENAPNLEWAVNVPIVKILKENFSMPIKLTNDANAAALGEKIYGKAKKMTDFITITLGTGLGSGFFVNGKIMHGYTGFAGEMGHINAVPGGRLCGCGKKGCLETYVSATGIRTTVIEMMQKLKIDSVLRQINTKDLDAKSIYQAAINGDKLAIDAFDFTAKILGEKLADIITLFSPQAIFLSGGLAFAGDILLQATKKYTEQNLMNLFKNSTTIELSGLLHKNSGILGAAALINME